MWQSPRSGCAARCKALGLRSGSPAKVMAAMPRMDIRLSKGVVGANVGSSTPDCSSHQSTPGLEVVPFVDVNTSYWQS